MLLLKFPKLNLLDPFPSFDIFDLFSDTGSVIPFISENLRTLSKELAKEWIEFGNGVAYPLYATTEFGIYLYWYRLFRRPYSFERWQIWDELGIKAKKYGEK